MSEPLDYQMLVASCVYREFKKYKNYLNSTPSIDHYHQIILGLLDIDAIVPIAKFDFSDICLILFRYELSIVLVVSQMCGRSDSY